MAESEEQHQQLINVVTMESELQTTHPTSGGVVTALTNSCANYVKTSRPQQWGPNLPYLGKPAMRNAGWLALLLIKPGDVETNPGPTTTHKQVWICDICHKQIHGVKQMSIRCNRIEHWVHLKMRRYPTSTIYRYMGLSSTQRIRTHNTQT